MIIVPAFSQRNQRKDKVVAALVARVKALAAPKVSQRINAEGAVVKKHRANKESPDEHLEPVCL